MKTTVEKHSNGTTAPSEGTWLHCGLWYRTYGTHHYHQLPPGTTRVIYEFPLCGKVTGSHLTAIGCLRAPTPLRQVLTVKNCTRWKSGNAVAHCSVVASSLGSHFAAFTSMKNPCDINYQQSYSTAQCSTVRRRRGARSAPRQHTCGGLGSFSAKLAAAGSLFQLKCQPVLWLT